MSGVGVVAELVAVTQRLLEAIAAKDWDTYEAMCDPSLTCFEPETNGHLVAGLPFHKHYFPSNPAVSEKTTTMAETHVRLLGPDAAVVSYSRLIQDEASAVTVSQETRVFQKTETGEWLNVHFHRTPQASL